MKVSRKLKNKIEDVVAEVVAQPNVNADVSAIEPITDAVLEEMQPRLDHLTSQEPWYRSRVAIGAILIIATRLLAHFGYKIPEELHGAILDLLIAFGPYAGAALALWGRYGAKKPLGA